MKTLAEEWKTSADAAQVFGSETCPVGGHTYLLFLVSSFTGAHTTIDLKVVEVVTMVGRLEEHSAALSQLASRLSAVTKFGAGAGEDQFADVKELITDNRLHSEALSGTRHKSHRDDELTKAGGEKVDLETQVATHSSKLGADGSRSQRTCSCTWISVTCHRN